MAPPTSLFSASSLLPIMASSLPKDASPQLQGPYDTIGLAIHAGMIAAGFKLKGLREDHTIPTDSEDSTTQPLPAQWNDFPSTIRFRYTHNQSSMEFIIKVDRLGGKATIDGIALGDDKRASFDITVKDFISEGSLPATPVSEGASAEETSRALQDIFISAGRLSDLGSELKVKVIQKLIPGLSKEGYEESEQTTDSASGRRDPRAPYPREPEQPQYDPLRYEPPPARPRPFGDPNFPPGLEQPPGWDDPLDTFRGSRGPMPGGRNPLGIGHDDLYPPGLGPNDPFRPGLGPSGLPRPGGGGGGMHPTFDDPLFGGRGGEGRRGDPQAPDGARYDPVFPGDPRGGPPTFPGAGHRGPGGGPPNPFGGYGSGDFI